MARCACSIIRFGAEAKISVATFSCGVAETKSIALFERKPNWMAAALFAFRPDGQMGLVLFRHSCRDYFQSEPFGFIWRTSGPWTATAAGLNVQRHQQFPGGIGNRRLRVAPGYSFARTTDHRRPGPGIMASVSTSHSRVRQRQHLSCDRLE